MVRFMAEQGAVPAVQLAHAGRKALVPGSIAPNALPFSEHYQTPVEMSEADMEEVVEGFRQAAVRAREAGFQAVEIHSAHGYLIHQFLSPLANRRSDRYGGSFENRIRLQLDVVRAVRDVWPDDLPLLVRISATDWAEGGWDIDQSVELARRLPSEGVDLIDVSSGGLTPDQKIQIGPGYQTPFAERRSG